MPYKSLKGVNNHLNFKMLFFLSFHTTCVCMPFSNKINTLNNIYGP